MTDINRISIFDKQLRSKYYPTLSVILAVYGVLTTLSCFNDFSDNTKIIVVCFILLSYLGVWWYLNNLREISGEINGTKITIKQGDIFKQQGLKLIAFNEYFDTDIKSGLISIKTLNGKFLKNYVCDIAGLDQAIENDTHCRKQQYGNNIKRKGKTKKYHLGTIFKYGNFGLVAFSKFDDNDNARLTLEEYFSCLFNFWNELNKIYNGCDGVIPLLGGGITRIDGNTLKKQDLLEILLQTLKYSNLHFIGKLPLLWHHPKWMI